MLVKFLYRLEALVARHAFPESLGDGQGDSLLLELSFLGIKNLFADRL